MLKSIKTSKTLQFSLALAVLGVIEASFGVFQAFLPEWAYGLALMAISIGVAVLRVVTTLPLDEK